MAQVFLGSDLMRIDQKGRVGIPSRFMPVLRAICPDKADAVGLMISPELSVKIMPMPCFLEELERWNRLDDRIDAERRLKTLVTGSADIVQLDKQNRIKLSPLMIETCGLRQEAVVAGCMDYMQVFDAEIWKTMFRDGAKAMSKAIEAAAEKEKPVAPVTIQKQIVINTADIEKNAERQEQDTTER